MNATVSAAKAATAEIEEQARSDALIKTARDQVDAYAAAAEKQSITITPKNLEDHLPGSFRELKRTLKTQQMQGLRNEFRAADEASNLYQTRYRNSERARIILFFLTLAVGALALTPWASAQAELANFVPRLQGALVAIALTVIASSLYLKHYEKWGAQRTQAEYAKNRFFVGIIEEQGRTDATDEIPFLLQKIEIFRRHRLQDQHGYMASKVKKHELSNRRRGRLLYLVGASAIIVTSVVVCSIVFPDFYTRVADWMMSAVPKPEGMTNVATLAATITALTIIISGLEAAITNAFRIEQDLRFAAHFRDTAHQLELVSNGLTDARRAAMNGDATAVAKFLNDIENILSKEHERWLSAHTNNHGTVRETKDLDPV
ncbi:MAG: hypothetical protein AAFY53_09685 [Pseudomonadota bacterium]